MDKDNSLSKSELLYELRLQRLENLRLRERLGPCGEAPEVRRQLRYLESTALIDKAIRENTDMDRMMNGLMEVIRDIFGCDQAWLLHPCDPDADSWHVPYRSVDPAYPINFGPEEALPQTEDLAENFRLALKTPEPLPLGKENSVKEVPREAAEVEAKAALLIALHPKLGSPWLMGLHHCSGERTWTVEEKRMYQDITGRIADALSATLFYRNLEENRQRLKHLSSQLFRSQEEERRRVAGEIHDEVGQSILAIKIGIENALFLLEDAQESAKNSLRSASNLSREVIDTIRRMQTALFPPTLRDFGVTNALNGFLDDFSNIYSTMEVRRQIRINEELIPEQLRTPIFRLAQEALYNAGRHSGGDTVTVGLDHRCGSLVLEIEDNGVGFDPKKTLRYPDTRLGLGLTSMKERAELSGGLLKIDARPGRGTTIRVIWRLEESPWDVARML
ncbi:hypothetical protein GM415_06435 [Pseudodesulfovibrio cashew]|uniref:Oxygen sensor histidine kinase NreB n=1 Tax=Pseudodesulfovibrio cashew TaxID=2678688 RepID=A0A6I6JHD7_9BACT|nr:sensor histidine kinase [Pseudodesulfovibrio cashew]QGY39772.1 hypothetical protein GM415_06435 [Pseudodesulfovibrio cashew]